MGVVINISTDFVFLRNSARQAASQDSGDLISDVAEDWISGTVTTSRKQELLMARRFVKMINKRLISARFKEVKIIILVSLLLLAGAVKAVSINSNPMTL